MWNVNGKALAMTEGDYGIKLPVTINGVTFAASDSVKLTIKSGLNGDAIIEKNYTNIEQNTVQLELTESESASLPVGRYVYVLDWYENGNFMCNVVPSGVFEVVEKA